MPTLIYSAKEGKTLYGDRVRKDIVSFLNSGDTEAFDEAFDRVVPRPLWGRGYGGRVVEHHLAMAKAVLKSVLYKSLQVPVAHQLGDHDGLPIVVTKVRDGDDVGVGTQEAHGLGFPYETLVADQPSDQAGGRLVFHARRLGFQLAEGLVTREMPAGIRERISQLRWEQGPSTLGVTVWVKITRRG